MYTFAYQKVIWLVRIILTDVTVQLLQDLYIWCQIYLSGTVFVYLTQDL